jgi:hypothetical protein
MLVDCDSCVVRGAACGGCVVSVMLGAPPSGVELDDEERRALAVLADAGMVPRLRLVTDDDRPPVAPPAPEQEAIPGTAPVAGRPAARRAGARGRARHIA